MRGFLNRIRLSPGWCFLLALLLRVLPLPWLGAALLAAGFHELGHLAALALWGVFPRRIQLGLGGAVIYPPFLSLHGSIFCTLAGPAASLALLAVRAHFPRLALCGAVQGICNLLPLPCSDGSRILGLLLGFLLPPCRCLRVLNGIQQLCLLAVSSLALAAGLFFHSLFPLTIIPVLLIFKQQIVKNPCKYRS